RTTIAMIFLAGLVDYLRRKGDARLVLSIRPVLLPVMLAAALLWFGKGIHAGVQVWNSTGSLSASIEPIRSLLAIRGKEVVMRSEPAVTQMILNEIVR